MFAIIFNNFGLHAHKDFQFNLDFQSFDYERA
jgi:hypothetical protein